MLEVIGLLASDLVASTVEVLREVLTFHCHDDLIDLQRASFIFLKTKLQLVFDLFRIWDYAFKQFLLRRSH